MYADIGYVTRLRWVYRVLGVLVMLHMLANMAYGLLAGTVLWSERDDRVTTWKYFWFWGQTLGTMPTPFAMLFLMYHTFFGFYYVRFTRGGQAIPAHIAPLAQTLHLILCGLAFAWHVIFAVMIIGVYGSCTQTFCDGVSLPPATYFPMKPDWSFIAYTTYVCACAALDIVYMAANFYIHRRTEFRVAAELVAESRAPPVGYSYLRAATNGGWSWLLDAFAPPGANSASFNPADGSLQQMSSGGGSSAYTRFTSAPIGDAPDNTHLYRRAHTLVVAAQ